MKHIYSNCLPLARGWLLKKGCKEENIKDFFQESMLILVQKVNQGKFELRSKLCTFLIEVSKRIFFKKIRDEPKFQEPGVYEKEEVEFPDFEEPKKSLVEFVEVLLENTSEKCQALIIARFWKKQKWEDCYEELGYSSAASARQQFSVCLKGLKGRISPEDLATLI